MVTQKIYLIDMTVMKSLADLIRDDLKENRISEMAYLIVEMELSPKAVMDVLKWPDEDNKKLMSHLSQKGYKKP